MFDFANDVMQELADQVSQTQQWGECLNAVTAFAYGDSQMILCYGNMALLVEVYKNRVNTERILVWRYNTATRFSLQFPHLMAYVKNAVEVWDITNGQLVQVLHAPAHKVLDGRD